MQRLIGRRAGMVLAAAGLCLIFVGCSDDPVATPSDARVEGIAGDGAQGDGAQSDGAQGDGAQGDGPIADGAAGDAAAKDGPAPWLDLPQTEGWIQTDNGVVKVDDGGQVIIEDSGLQVVCYPTLCAGKLLACGDCVDNDGDGKIDWRDPECLGPCDNTEGPGLESGVGGTTGAQCGVDCYFDFGNGAGNDDCWWDHRCDPLEPEKTTCPYDSNLLGGKKCPAQQSPKCAQNCLPYTPNGCDCFGCCTFPDLTTAGPGGNPGYVWIGAMDSSNNSTCTLATLKDPAKCPPCTPVPGCFKPCGKCQLCIGKTTLPPECYAKPDAGVPADAAPPVGDGAPPTGDGAPPAGDGAPPTGDGSTPSDAGTPSQQCPGGEQPCGLPGQALCQKGFYCITGCCIEIIIN